MKKIIGIISLVIIFSLYITFLFVLPKVVDINQYKAELQKIVHEQTGINLEYDNASLTTAPLLSVGVSLDNIIVKLPDNSELFTSDNIKIRISLPSLLLLTVKVPCAEISNPKLNLDIAQRPSGKENYKLVMLIEDLLTENDVNIENEVPEVEKSFDITKYIRIKVPALKLKNYDVLVNDLRSKHWLELKGDELKVSYDVKTFGIKTNAQLFSDNNKNINANIDFNCFIPKTVELDEEDDKNQHVEIPFINPVLTYRNYDLKANVDSKLRIKQAKNTIKIYGNVNVDNLTMNLAGLQLPESYFKSQHKGTFFNVDSNLVITDGQSLKLQGEGNYGYRHFLDMKILSDKIFFNDILAVAKALLDSLQIKNDLNNLSTSGYLMSDAYIKTNFKTLKSSGGLHIKDGNFVNKARNINFSDITADIIFDNDTLNIQNADAYFNDAKMALNGSINEKSYADINFSFEKVMLSDLFNAFAPNDLRKSILIQSGLMDLKFNAKGKLKELIAQLKLDIKSFCLKDYANNFVISDDELNVDLTSDLKTAQGSVVNNKFKIQLPASNSTINNDKFTFSLNDKDIIIAPSVLQINSDTKIAIEGSIKDYISKPLYNIIIDGDLYAKDLKQLLGKMAEPFIAANGKLPMILTYNGDNKKQTVDFSIKADKNNYFTPIHYNEILDKNTVLKFVADIKPNRIKIKDTGLFEIIPPVNPEGKGEETLPSYSPFIDVEGTIANTDLPIPHINMLKVITPKPLTGHLQAFENSYFASEAKIFIFGESILPRLRGHITVNNIKIPELLTSLDKLNFKFNDRTITMSAKNLLLNGSDLNCNTIIDYNTLPILTLSRMNIESTSVDVDKLLKVVDNLNKYIVVEQPKNNVAQEPQNIPIEIKNSYASLKQIKTGNIVVNNTTTDMSLKDNVFYLNNLRANIFNGRVFGDIGVNLLTTGLSIAMNGRDLNVEKALLDSANVKDALTGRMDFVSRLSLSGTSYEEQVKSLEGNVKFSIFDGQLGPFGKLENMILAENIRENQFFQTTIGSVLNSIATIDTTHYSVLQGDIDIKDAIAQINSITSQGNTLCMNLFGNFDILKNTIDMKVRAKLASNISDMLGPLSNISPVNLVKNTPGLNVASAKMFALFCESVTNEEISLIPDFFGDAKDSNATKFQIVLRGDVNKPFTLVKSFKWLASTEEIAEAQAFVDTLPEPVEEETQIVEEKQNVFQKFLNFFKKKKDNSNKAEEI